MSKEIRRIIERGKDREGIECPVCGASKHPYSDYCEDCHEYEARVIEIRRIEKRRRTFG